jgi:hypothetical protein
MDEIGIGEILQKRFGIHRQKNTWFGNLSALDENWITKTTSTYMDEYI